MNLQLFDIDSPGPKQKVVVHGGGSASQWRRPWETPAARGEAILLSPKRRQPRKERRGSTCSVLGVINKSASRTPRGKSARASRGRPARGSRGTIGRGSRVRACEGEIRRKRSAGRFAGVAGGRCTGGDGAGAAAGGGTGGKLARSGSASLAGRLDQEQESGEQPWPGGGEAPVAGGEAGLQGNFSAKDSSISCQQEPSQSGCQQRNRKSKHFAKTETHFETSQKEVWGEAREQKQNREETKLENEFWEGKGSCWGSVHCEEAEN